MWGCDTGTADAGNFLVGEIFDQIFEPVFFRGGIIVNEGEDLAAGDLTGVIAFEGGRTVGAAVVDDLEFGVIQFEGVVRLENDLEVFVTLSANRLETLGQIGITFLVVNDYDRDEGFFYHLLEYFNFRFGSSAQRS